ncbi:MAG: tRNA adenosine(34) deaminase TadA [Gammaproteobacteria bacterium]|nr:tRNA adenosine(34) deaminase TadA [Gammaproteobacteria bacterium]
MTGVTAQTDHEHWMQVALTEARQAALAGEVPVGAVVVVAGREVGRGHNRPVSAGDPTSHAEMEALRDAARQTRNYRLPGATLYVTVEPCMMCAGALVHARVERLVFGTREPKAGAVRSAARVLDWEHLNHRVAVVEGVLAEDCRELMSSFFAHRRGEASTPQ